MVIEMDEVFTCNECDKANRLFVINGICLRCFLLKKRITRLINRLEKRTKRYYIFKKI